MAEKTTHSDSLDPTDAADRLSDVANALHTGDNFSIRVGNKEIQLSPAETVEFSIEVVEKRRRFRGNRETIRIELDWNPE